MSNYSRRAASSRPSGGECPVTTKAELVEFLGYEGRTLKQVRTNSGEWNDATSYYAVFGDESNPDNWLMLDKCMRGDRRDWQYMWDAFKEGRMS